jgi:hypothetical protein
MQIHEITRRNISEAGMLSAIGGQLAKNVTQKLLPGAAQNPLAGQVMAPNSRQAGAMAVNAPLVAQLSKVAQQNWLKSVQYMVANSQNPTTQQPATSAAELKPEHLEQELNNLVKNLAGFDVATLASMNDNSGQAKETDDRMKKAKAAVLKLTQDPKSTPALKNAAWTELATMISQAMNVHQFVGGSQAGKRGEAATITFDPNGKPLYNGRAFNPNDPSHVLAQQQYQNAQPKK